MKALRIATLVILILIVIVAGSVQLQSRDDEKDKAVADAAEVETSNPAVIDSSGIKPVNIDKTLAEMKGKGIAMESIDPASTIKY